MFWFLVDEKSKLSFGLAPLKLLIVLLLLILLITRFKGLKAEILIGTENANRKPHLIL
jgi:hypothetical protein